MLVLCSSWGRGLQMVLVVDGGSVQNILSKQSVGHCYLCCCRSVRQPQRRQSYNLWRAEVKRSVFKKWTVHGHTCLRSEEVKTPAAPVFAAHKLKCVTQPLKVFCILWSAAGGFHLITVYFPPCAFLKWVTLCKKPLSCFSIEWCHIDKGSSLRSTDTEKSKF